MCVCVRARVCVCVYQYGYRLKDRYINRFDLFSLFNGMSTFAGYLMPKPSFRRTVVVLFNPQLRMCMCSQ